MVELEVVPAQMEQRESIKLEKNSRGYNWEIRILSEKLRPQITSFDIERLETLNDMMQDKFGPGKVEA